MRLTELAKLTGLPVLAASLCCLSPVLIAALGLSSVSFAASLANTLYGDYKWGFRALGLALLAGALVAYFRRRKICTLDDVRKHRRQIVNTVILALAAGVVGYIVFLYVIVHYLGVWLHLW